MGSDALSGRWATTVLSLCLNSKIVDHDSPRADWDHFFQFSSSIFSLFVAPSTPGKV